MSLHPRRRSVGFHVAAVVWLTAVWVLLWGRLSVANLLAGAGLAVLAVRAFPMPAIDYHGRLRPWGLLRLAGWFVADLVVASVQVAALALGRRRPESAVVRVRLRSHSDLYLTLTAQLCSLVPGSVVVEALRTDGVLYVHVLDVRTTGVEAARDHVLRTEERVLRALASDAELAQAGLAQAASAPDGSAGSGPTDVRRTP